MAQRALNELVIRRLHAARKPCYVRADAGLYFRVQSAGARPSWMFRYKLGGKPKWMMRGHFPDLPLAEAKGRARAQRVAIDDGKDPQLERLRQRQALANDLSVTEVANRWHSLWLQGYTVRVAYALHRQARIRIRGATWAAQKEWKFSFPLVDPARFQSLHLDNRVALHRRMNLTCRRAGVF